MRPGQRGRTRGAEQGSIPESLDGICPFAASVHSEPVSSPARGANFKEEENVGELAEDMEDGSCCGMCAVYFKETHGYPVLCKQCWREADALERAMWQRARIPEA